MTWLAWRQFRVSALSTFAVLAVIGAVLVISGLNLAGETNFSDQETIYTGTQFALLALPAVLGMFWAVPMVTRELENGTHNIVWNQSITRTHWLSAKMALGAPTAMAAAGLLSLAVTWWASPMDTQANAGELGAFDPQITPLVFAIRGIAPIGYAAFAYAVGVAAGILLRRTVPAMAITLVVFTAVQVLVPLAVRPYILPPVTRTLPITTETIQGIGGKDVNGQTVIETLVATHPAGAWVISDTTVDQSGNKIDPLPSTVNGCLEPLPPPEASHPKPNIQGLKSCLSQLSDLGYHQRLVYQPANRFWPLQWLELGFFLALSTLLTWFSFRRIRRLP